MAFFSFFLSLSLPSRIFFFLLFWPLVAAGHIFMGRLDRINRETSLGGWVILLHNTRRERNGSNNASRRKERKERERENCSPAKSNESNTRARLCPLFRNCHKLLLVPLSFFSKGATEREEMPICCWNKEKTKCTGRKTGQQVRDLQRADMVKRTWLLMANTTNSAKTKCYLNKTKKKM